MARTHIGLSILNSENAYLESNTMLKSPNGYTLNDNETTLTNDFAGNLIINVAKDTKISFIVGGIEVFKIDSSGGSNVTEGGGIK